MASVLARFASLKDLIDAKLTEDDLVDLEVLPEQIGPFLEHLRVAAAADMAAQLLSSDSEADQPQTGGPDTDAAVDSSLLQPVVVGKPCCRGTVRGLTGDHQCCVACVCCCVRVLCVCCVCVCMCVCCACCVCLMCCVWCACAQCRA